MCTAARGAVAGCAVVILAAGCGLQRAPHTAGQHPRASHRGSGTPRATRTPRPGGTPPAVVAQCVISEFRIRLDARSAGVAAGTSYLPIDFTNVGSASCRLAGFPQVAIAAGASGKQIGAPATRDSSTAAMTMVLAAGHTAHIWVRLANVVNLPAAKCEPVLAAGLRVSLPGQPQATFLGHQLTSCARQVTGTDVLTIEPFRPGMAQPGRAQ